MLLELILYIKILFSSIDLILCLNIKFPTAGKNLGLQRKFYVFKVI